MLGFEHNPAIAAAQYAEKAAHRERQAAIGLFMPKVSVKGAYTHLDKDIKIDLNHFKTNFSGVLGGVLNNPDVVAALSPYLPAIQGGLSSLLGIDLSYTLQQRNIAFLGGDVVMPIFAGGKIWTANRASKINEQRVKQQSLQVRGALTVEIVERYFGVELAQRGVAIRREAVAVVEQHLHDVAMLEKEGMAVESERLYAEYRLAEAERDLRRTELQLETARKALQSSLGTERRIEPATQLFLLNKVEPLEYFVAMAKLHNPQLGEVEQLRELSRMNLRLHRADYFPEIAAMGGMLSASYGELAGAMILRWNRMGFALYMVMFVSFFMVISGVWGRLLFQSMITELNYASVALTTSIVSLIASPLLHVFAWLLLRKTEVRS